MNEMEQSVVTYVKWPEAGAGPGHPLQRGVRDVAAPPQVQVPAQVKVLIVSECDKLLFKYLSADVVTQVD